MTGVQMFAVHNKTNVSQMIEDLNDKLEPFEAREMLGRHTLKSIMESGKLGILLDVGSVVIHAQINGDVKEIKNSGGLRAALKNIVVCHTCGNQK